MSEKLSKEIVYQADDGNEIRLTQDLIKSALVSGTGKANATPKELFLFAKMCESRKMNPFIGDAYLVKNGTYDAQQVISKSYWMRKLKQEAGFKHYSAGIITTCLLYTSPSPRDGLLSRMPSSA